MTYNILNQYIINLKNIIKDIHKLRNIHYSKNIFFLIIESYTYSFITIFSSHIYVHY